jgi:small-conductance mechanosensitive channel
MPPAVPCRHRATPGGRSEAEQVQVELHAALRGDPGAIPRQLGARRLDGFLRRRGDSVHLAIRFRTLDILHAVAACIPNLIFIGVILILAGDAARIVRWFFSVVERGDIVLPGFYTEWARPTFQIARFLLVVFTAVVVFPYLPGSQSPAVQGISLFVGLLVSLGSSSAISHVISGTMLTDTRAFQVGDRVQIGDNVGDVVARTLLVTHLRTIKNVEIAVPTAHFLGTLSVSSSAAARDRGLLRHTSVAIGYDVPWWRVHELVVGAARATPAIEAEPAPFVLQTALDDDSVRDEINATTRDAASMARIDSDLNQAIQDAFRDAGVEILAPLYAAVRDGNRSNVPAVAVAGAPGTPEA